MPKMISQSVRRSSSRGGVVTSFSGDDRVVILVLCEEETFTTTGAGATYVGRHIGPVLDGLGPHIQDIVIHSLGRAFSTNFGYHRGHSAVDLRRAP